MIGAGLAVVKFAADSILAYAEAQLVMAQTNAVLESTGGAANVTAEVYANRQHLGREDQVIEMELKLIPPEEPICLPVAGFT